MAARPRPAFGMAAAASLADDSDPLDGHQQIRNAVAADKLELVEVITDGTGAAWVELLGHNPYIFATDDPGDILGTMTDESAVPKYSVIAPDYTWLRR